MTKTLALLLLFLAACRDTPTGPQEPTKVPPSQAELQLRHPECQPPFCQVLLISLHPVPSP